MNTFIRTDGSHKVYTMVEITNNSTGEKAVTYHGDWKHAVKAAKAIKQPMHTVIVRGPRGRFLHA